MKSWTEQIMTKRSIVIDTETTGLDSENDEILQVSIISSNEDVLFDSLIRPVKKTVLFALAGMIGLNAIKPKRKNMHIILAIIGLVMIIPYMVFMDSNLGTFNKDVEISVEYYGNNIMYIEVANWDLDD